MISMLIIPILPVMWVFFRSPWHVVPLNILSGILWTAHGLASFNFLLELAPEGQRARYSALFQIVVTVSLAIGAALGGIIVTQWGYFAVFLGSGIGRMSAALLFARFVHPVQRDALAIPEIRNA
jgi:predicted MFS family arabinose efflux permease